MVHQYYESSDEALEPVAAGPTVVRVKPDAQLWIFTLQTLICVMIITVCFILKFLAGDLYRDFAAWYRTNVGTKANIEQVLQGKQDTEKQNENLAAVGVGGPAEYQPQNNVAASLQTGFIMPIQGTVTSQFGYRADPFTGVHSMHNGYDIGAAAGTKVIAAMGGTVVKAVTGNQDYGNYVVIQNGRVQNLYGHLSDLSVSTGQTVSQGQTVGLCGSTGRSTGPHLHFEILVDGKRIDPAPFLQPEK